MNRFSGSRWIEKSLTAIVLATCLLPGFSSADYLYSTERTAGPPPYVLFIADTSGSMDTKDAELEPCCEDRSSQPEWECCDRTSCYDSSTCYDSSKCSTKSNCGGKNQPECCPKDRTPCPTKGTACTSACLAKPACSNVCGRLPLCSKAKNQSRMEALRSTLLQLIPTLDGITLGLEEFPKSTKRGTGGSKATSDSCASEVIGALPTGGGTKALTQSELLALVTNLQFGGGTPTGSSLKMAKEHLDKVKAADVEGKTCRKYVVILLTDGVPESCANEGGKGKTQADYAKDQMTALRDAGFPAYVIGFGKEVKGATILNELAQRGGTARIGGEWCNDIGRGCSNGVALQATSAGELTEVLTLAFDEIQKGQFSPMPPIVSTVAQARTEVDRVSRNFLAYSAFEQPGYKGHLYGIQLFQEQTSPPGEWAFTDFNHLDLKACGQAGNPCLFDAGQMLQERPSSKPRRIFSAVPRDSAAIDGGVTLDMGTQLVVAASSTGSANLQSVVGAVLRSDALGKGFGGLSSPDQLALTNLARSDTAGRASAARVVDWLHGASRGNALGDLYHSAPAIVSTPPYAYRRWGYPEFKASRRDRPAMIYVGANDGMIHAFHAGPDLQHSTDPEWKAGEEAWAYLPFNMAAKVSLAALTDPAPKRVFSQDLSCRVDDVLTVDNGGDGMLACKGDPDCGWKTVLVCGQGWGGSWYVALDVTDPLKPKPLWEATHEGVVNGLSTEPYGLGRTWGVPSIAVVNMKRDGKSPLPTWLSIFGSGYNTALRDASGYHSSSYRLLNMPFAGVYPEHGAGTQGEQAHVFIQDMASGRFLKVFHQHGLGAILADLPVVDLDQDSFSDAIYVGGWNQGQMDRIALVSSKVTGNTYKSTSPDEWSNACKDVFHFGNNNPITSRPAAYADPRGNGELYLFVGTGVDKGVGPDQQTNEGKFWDFRAYYLKDKGGLACPTDPVHGGTVPNAGNMCTDASMDDGKKKGWTFNGIFNDGQRLLSAPTLSILPDKRRLLTFTSWKPTASTCGSGVSSLYCVDVTGTQRCVPCGNLRGDGDETAVRIDLSNTKPSTPTMADGQLYTVGPDGVLRVGNPTGTGAGPVGDSSEPNQGKPRPVLLSWREIF
ncbi:PilC/PilY family type IV pilus protein [Vulgatibacter incomptus]|uniref:Type IV fimbrial biogenesis protein PilY1 n=1 Tax=Vulgatibacter incomptus TaxID=1391653 RepID=A0A0K1PDV9_9BACT|nr:PilC/PilY family type IV pilus protein [Vulgatibacter incomptus]AKU91708.1 Type IV fimbrial biogenesis protein PilY1 [Vulgatibacter incomptus]